MSFTAYDPLPQIAYSKVKFFFRQIFFLKVIFCLKIIQGIESLEIPKITFDCHTKRKKDLIIVPTSM